MAGKCEMKVCPHCGSDSGYYRKARAVGITTINYPFDESPPEIRCLSENSHLWDDIELREFKRKYCINCERIFQ